MCDRRENRKEQKERRKKKREKKQHSNFHVWFTWLWGEVMELRGYTLHKNSYGFSSIRV